MTAFNVDQAPLDTCRSCGAELVWAVTEQGKPMPVNRAPDLDSGNVWLTAEERLGINPRATVLNGTEAVRRRKNGEPLHTSHFATCPSADLHRKRRPRR